jgi:hypothetical protein
MDIQKLFDNIEKAFRYLIPAFVFTVLLKYFEPVIYDNYINPLTGTKFIFFFLLIGMSIYSIHRIVFELFDWIVLHVSDESEPNITLLSLKLKAEERNYYYYKSATIHSVLLIAELIFIFIIFHWDNKYLWYLILTGLLFLLAVIIYCRHNIIQIEFIKKRAVEVKNEKLL